MELISEEKIDEIVNKIVVNYQPDKIILFGSYARGNPTVDSDLDLAIIKDTPLPHHKRNLEIRKFLFGSMVPMDILVYTQSEIAQSENNKYSFVYEVLKTGKILYER